MQVELACLKFPYSKWTTPFDQLKAVVHEPSPTVPGDQGYSNDFSEFVDKWYVCVYIYFLDTRASVSVP